MTELGTKIDSGEKRLKLTSFSLNDSLSDLLSISNNDYERHGESVK